MSGQQQTTEDTSSECRESPYNNSTHCMGCKVGPVIYYHHRP